MNAHAMMRAFLDASDDRRATFLQLMDEYLEIDDLIQYFPPRHPSRAERRKALVKQFRSKHSI